MEYTKSFDWFDKRLKSLKKYTSAQELEALTLPDESLPSEILEVLSDIKPLNELEALALIYKLREISVSDLIEITIPCGHCEYMNIYNIEIEEYFSTVPDSLLPPGIFTEVEDIINTKKADDLILKEYFKIKKELLSNSTTIFSASIKRKCDKCKESLDISIAPLSIISKSSLGSIFKEYVDISYYSNMTKLDVDSMYPFQREITLNLLSEKIKESTQLPKGL